MEEGDFVNIIGRSGSGKSTFLNLLSGLLKPTEGKIFAKGKDMSDFSDREISKYRNEVIGFVPQSLGTLPNLNVLENVSLPYYLFKRDDSAYEKAAMLLDEMGILHLKDDFPKNLSGGELKRVLIARSMINSPELLILDEPTAGLDPEGRDEILSEIKNIYDSEDDMTVIIVSHSMEDIAKVANRVIVMNQGKVFADDRPEIIYSMDEELDKIGLDVPQITRATKLLEEKGYKFSKTIITVEEAYQELIAQLGGKHE